MSSLLSLFFLAFDEHPRSQHLLKAEKKPIANLAAWGEKMLMNNVMHRVVPML
jgi:hypothetical protein